MVRSAAPTASLFPGFLVCFGDFLARRNTAACAFHFSTIGVRQAICPVLSNGGSPPGDHSTRGSVLISKRPTSLSPAVRSGRDRTGRSKHFQRENLLPVRVNATDENGFLLVRDTGLAFTEPRTWEVSRKCVPGVTKASRRRLKTAGEVCNRVADGQSILLSCGSF